MIKYPRKYLYRKTGTASPKKENGSTEKEGQFHRKHGTLIESGIGEGAFSQAVSEHREILVYVTYVYVVTAGLIPPAALRHVGIILPQKTKLQLSTKVHFSLSNKEQFFLFNKEYFSLINKEYFFLINNEICTALQIYAGS